MPDSPQPCPWCGAQAEVRVVGSYVEGWLAYVFCTGPPCDAHGPSVQTGSLSRNKRKTQDEAVRLWNRIGLKSA